MSFLQDAYNQALENLNTRIQKAIDELDDVLTDNVVEGSVSSVPLALPDPAQTAPASQSSIECIECGGPNPEADSFCSDSCRVNYSQNNNAYYR